MSDFINKILKSLEIIKEMYEYRGLTTPYLENISVDEINTLLEISHNNSLNIIEIKINDDTKLIYILAKYSQKMIKNFLTNNYCRNIIVITSDNVSSTKTIIKDIIGHNSEADVDDEKVEYQLFKLRELQYNISKHIMCPKHELINDSETINKIIKILHIENKSKLPRILMNDPMAKFINMKSGNLVKITSRNKSSGEYISYKYCV